jgi:pantetheine-phosphate adenylyltransferase
LHAGHKILLTLSAWIAKTRLFVGVTGHELLVNKLHKETMQSLDERINNVTAFLGEMHQGLQYQVECIHDAYGPTITDASFTALVVSKETEKGGKSVLVERGKCGMPAMELFVIDVLGGHGDKMSSSWIRGYLAAQ